MIILKKNTKNIIATHDDMAFVFVKVDVRNYIRDGINPNIGWYIDDSGELRKISIHSIYGVLFLNELMG